MWFFRRVLGAMVLFLSTLGIICSIAGVLGIWMFHQAVYEKVTNIADRLEDGLERATVANQKVQRALDRAHASMDEVNKESVRKGGRDEKSRRTTSTLRALVRRQVEPSINDLGIRLDTLSDTATVLSSLIQSFQEIAPSLHDRIYPEKLEGWTDQMTQLSTTLRRLKTVVGDNDKESNGGEIATACSGVDLALQRCQAKMDDWQSGVETVREGVRGLKAQALGWLALAAITVSSVCLWAAISQISLFAHALSWCRNA